MIITDKIEVDDKILASGGFADVRCGTYAGQLVAVKTLRVDVATLDDPRKIRKVSASGVSSSPEAQFQPLCSSNFARKSFSGALYPTRTS